MIGKNADMPILLPISGFFEKAQLTRIFQEVKKIILDWTIELEKKGVLGEEYMFTNEEKERAKTVPTFNITINGNVLGNNAFGPIQDSSLNIGNAPVDFEKVASLTEQISENIQSIGLSDTERQQLLSDISEIHSALVKKDSSVIQKVLNHIKSLCSNAAGSLIASGIIQQISCLIP